MTALIASHDKDGCNNENDSTDKQTIVRIRSKNAGER